MWVINVPAPPTKPTVAEGALEAAIDGVLDKVTPIKVDVHANLIAKITVDAEMPTASVNNVVAWIVQEVGSIGLAAIAAETAKLGL